MKTYSHRLYILFSFYLSILLLFPYSLSAEYRHLPPISETNIHQVPLHAQDAGVWGTMLLLLLGLSIVLGVLASIVFAFGGASTWLYLALSGLGGSLLFSAGAFLLGSSHPHSSWGLFVGIALVAFGISLFLQGVPLLIAGLVQGIAWVTVVGSVAIGLPMVALVLLQLW